MPQFDPGLDARVENSAGMVAEAAGSALCLAKQRSPSADGRNCQYSNMKAFAHLSPTVPAIFVAAMGISLSAFLLSGARVQGEPTPLLAVIGGAAGRVAADLPAPVAKRASEPVRKAASSAQLAATRPEHFVPHRRQVATKAHRAHRRAQRGVVERAPFAHPQAATPATPAAPDTTQLPFSSATTATSKARGHGHGRARKSTAGAPVPRAHGHGKAFGRSSEHHHGLPRGHGKKAPTAPSSAPTTPPKVNGGGNGHKGGKK